MKLFKQPKNRYWSVILASSIVLAGCASAPPPEPSLYDRLGGLPVITAIIDKAVDRHASSPLTRRSFEGVNLKTLKASIVSQLCNATGGPCKYEGATMSKAHADLAITSTEFDTAIAQLGEALDELHVGAREKGEVLQLVLPLKSDIVTR